MYEADTNLATQYLYLRVLRAFVVNIVFKLTDELCPVSGGVPTDFSG